MGKKKGGAGNGSNTKPPSAPVKYQPVALRQQSGTGGAAAAVITTTQGLNPSNQARALRVDHLLRVATWASANVPPLGALLGARLGDLCESAGVPVPGSPHSICERCESVMQVGENCSVRVTKSKRGRRPSKYSNGVTTTCHMCTHENVSPGTLKTHLKTKLAQAAARLNLNLLGKSSVAKQQALSLNLVNEKQQQQQQQQQQQGVVGEERCLENLQGVTKQEGSKTVEVTLDMETLDVIENNQCEQEAGKPVEVALSEVPLDHTGANNEQSFVEQEGATTVDLVLNSRSLDLMQKEQQGFDEQEGGELVEVTLNEAPLDHTGKKNEKGSTQQEGLKSVTGGTSVSRLPLDLSSKKKRKKKNQQGGGGVEQEGPIRNTTSPGKGLAVESSDSARKKKCKGWSTLKELASLP